MRWRLHTGAPTWTQAGWAKIEEARFDDAGQIEAIIAGLDVDNRRLVLRPDEVCLPLFYGVIGDGTGPKGHYLYSSRGDHLVSQSEFGFFDQPIDGQMQPRSSQAQGVALLTHLKTASQTPWTILSMCARASCQNLKWVVESNMRSPIRIFYVCMVVSKCGGR